jgi:orotidine-5'-phosphate decarboxylase
MASRLAPHVAGFKVGLELLLGSGPEAVSSVAALGLPVFADAKLHDIPNTMRGAARELGRRGARWVTVHAGAGVAGIEAARDGLRSGAGAAESGVLVVTVLTSLTEADLERGGIERSLGDQVEAMAALAAACGAEGVVCPPTEVRRVKGAEPTLTVVCPGIRLPGDPGHDQRRVGTPRQAIEDGADFLVVGRSITAADDPAVVARAISEGLV